MMFCECRGSTKEAQAYIAYLKDVLDQVEIQRIGGPESSVYLRFPLTTKNKYLIIQAHAKRIPLLHFSYLRVKDWQYQNCSHVLLGADNLWLEFNHELCFEFIDGLWSKCPRITALPYSIGAKRPPGIGISDCYYLPYQIIRVPGLEAWLENASSSFCAVPFPQSRRNHMAIYDAYPDADERCQNLVSWGMNEPVWNLTDYALIVPRHTISLAHSATIEGRVPGGDNEGKAPFHLRDLMGIPTVWQEDLRNGLSYLSEEVNTFDYNNEICDRRTIYPKELVATLFSSLNSRQRGRLVVYPVEVL